MTGSRKRVSEINERILAGKASVYTEEDLLKHLEKNDDSVLRDADVVIMSFSSSISGAAAMLLVPVAGRGSFTRAKNIRLDGVPGYPGPAPNERLGIVDSQVFADQRVDNWSNGLLPGTRLLTDVLENREIQVECLSQEEDDYRSSFVTRELEYARMVTYNTFIPHTRINETSNSHLKTICVGSKILLNGSVGIVVGAGTRNGLRKKSLSLSAELYEMDPNIITVENDDVKLSIVIPIPVIDELVWNDLLNYLRAMKYSDISHYMNMNDLNMARWMKDQMKQGRFKLNDSSNFPISW
jgi:uncharacterized protein (DUF39 family)